MESIIKFVPIQHTTYTVLVLVGIGIACVKYVPILLSWFNTARIKANEFENISKAIEKNTAEIELINQKIGRDYARINHIMQIVEKQQRHIEDSLEERELILRSLLGLAQGLQEIGANGPTKSVESEIQSYLLKKSHDVNM